MSAISNRLKNLKDYRNTKDPKVRDRIIVEYAPLVKFIAKKIASRLPANIELDDLISCGVIGLMDAIEKFDSSRDNKFKTYAEFRIRGSILDELRSQDWVPRSVRDKVKMIDRAYAKLESKLGRPANDEEMRQELGVNIDEYHVLLNKAKSVSVLNIDDSSLFSRTDKKLLVNLIESRSNLNPFSSASFGNIQGRIKKYIKSLPDKQRMVLSLYYYEGLNLKEIGQVLEVTESRVSQLHSQAVVRLKTKLRGDLEREDALAG